MVIDRYISQKDIEKIIYEDGIVHAFKSEIPIPTYFKSGKYIEGAIGFSKDIQRSTPVGGYVDPYGNPIQKPINLDEYYAIFLSFTFGNYWYFGNRPKWRPGLLVNWVKLGTHFDLSSLETFLFGTRTLSLCNIGMANSVRIKDGKTIEFNFTTGYCFNLDLENDYSGSGISVSPEIKLRLNKLSIGINYQYFYSQEGAGSNSNMNILSISMGHKFSKR